MDRMDILSVRGSGTVASSPPLRSFISRQAVSVKLALREPLTADGDKHRRPAPSGWACFVFSLEYYGIGIGGVSLLLMGGSAL